MASESGGTRSVTGLIALGGAVLVAGTAVAWFSLTGGDAPESQEPIAAPQQTAEADTAEQRSPSVAEPIITAADDASERAGELAEQAASALQAGALTGPDGALALYQRALEAQPDLEAAQAGLANAVTAAVESARTALGQGDATTAQQAVVAALIAAPGDSRLAALQSEIAISGRMQPMLDQARALEARGQLVSQDNSDSAVSVYRAVLTFDRENAVAAERLRAIQETLADRVDRALAAADTDAATTALRNLELAGGDGVAQRRRNLEQAIAAATPTPAAPPPAPPPVAAAPAPAPTAPAPAVVAAPATEEDLRTALLANQVQAAQLAERAGRIAPPDTNNAWDLLSAVLEQDPNYTPAREAAEGIRQSIASRLAAAVQAGNAQQAGRWLTAAGATGVSGDQIDSLGTAAWEVYANQARTGTFDHVLSVSQVEVVRQVPPEYPSQLGVGSSRGTGVVDVQFTIDEQGRVDDSEVSNSTLSRVFDRSALRAIDRWRFRPYLVAGRPVPVRAQVRFSFN